MNRILCVMATYLLLLLPTNTFADNAKDDAMKAYYSMEEFPFDRNVFNESIALIEAAYQDDSDEPWVYIASSLAIMQAGYKIGSWYDDRSFQNGVIDDALQMAEKAKQLGENESQAYAHLARVFIIKKEYRKAWDLLNKAYQLDSRNYYAWFYKALIGYYMKSYDKALSNLDEAEKLITHKYQKKLVTRQKGRIAKRVGDKALEERLYKKNIEDFPENAYMYGNYALFLQLNNRPKEAIIYYEKAIAIKPYPVVLTRLAEVKKQVGIE